MNLDNLIAEATKKTLKAFIRENTYKKPLNEYLDKYYGSALKKYLTVSDEEKRYIAFQDNCPYFVDFFDEWASGRYIDVDEETMDKIKDCSENYDWDGISAVLIDKFGYDAEKIFNDFYDKIDEYKYSSYEYKTHDVMDYNRTIKNDWLVHFSDNAWEIAREGFQYGTSDFDDLGYSGCSTKGKAYGEDGMNFAFQADRVSNWNCGKYGDEAVLFKASGVEAYHQGDDEYQVMFYNKEAKDIIYLQHSNETDEWCVSSWRNGNILYKTEDIETLIQWVIDNLPQYRKHLIYPKESKVRRDNYKKSAYNYGRKFT